MIEEPDVSDHVLQASGVIAEQCDCTSVEGFGRLKIRAAAAGQTLEEMALDVMDGVVRFDG